AAGLVISEWRKRQAQATVTFAAFWLAYAAWISGFHTAPPAGPIFLFLTCAFLIFLTFLTWRFLVRAGPLGRQDAWLLTLNGLIYFGVCYDLLAKDYEPYR